MLNFKNTLASIVNGKTLARRSFIDSLPPPYELDKIVRYQIRFEIETRCFLTAVSSTLHSAARADFPLQKLTKSTSRWLVDSEKMFFQPTICRVNFPG